MTGKNVVKQLEELLEPIKKDLGGVKRDLGEINKKLEQHTKILDQHTKKLDQHTGALINIEDTIKIYGDMYQVNSDPLQRFEYLKCVEPTG